MMFPYRAAESGAVVHDPAAITKLREIDPSGALEARMASYLAGNVTRKMPLDEPVTREMPRSSPQR